MTIQSAQLNGTTLTLKLDNGQEVELEVKVKEQKTYRIGQKFKYLNGETYLLCAPAVGVSLLISIKDGVRWNDGCSVPEWPEIYEENFYKLFGNNPSGFTLIQ